MKNTLAFSVLLLAVAVVGVLVIVHPEPSGDTYTTVLGSGGEAFSYKHYTSTSASSTKGTVVFGGAGVLGGVHINSPTATAQVVVYDGATTATSGLDVIAKFPTGALGGTYDFNVAVAKGVVVELPSGFTGDITFSVR